MQTSDAEKARLLRFTVITSFLALLPTAWIAFASRSLVLQADFYRAAAEFLAIVISWFVLLKASSTDSAIYNYGLGKLEHMASLIVATAMLVTTLVLIFTSIHRFQNPVPIEHIEIGIVLATLSVLGNLYIYMKSTLYLKRATSPVVDAQKRLFLTKAVASFIVVLSLAVSYFLADISHISDAMGSFVIAGFLLYSAYSIVSSSMEGLLDHSLEEILQLEILKALLEFEEHYDGFQSVRSRFAGSQVFIEIFLEFKPERSIVDIQAAHDRIAERVKARIKDSEVNLIASLQS